jgi:hypothetical protein
MVRRYRRALAAIALCATIAIGSAPEALAARHATAIPSTYNTSLVVANPGDDEAFVTLNFRTPDGTAALNSPPTFSVKPGSSVLTYVPNIPNLPDGRYSVTVESSRYVAVLTNLAASDAPTATAYNGVSDTFGDYFTTLNAPFVANNLDGYTTSIVVQNGQGTAANVTITYRDGDGNVVTTENRSIPAYSASLFDQTGTPNLGDGGRAAVITSDRFVSAVVLVAHPSTNRLASYRAMRAADTSVFMPVVYNQYAGYVTALFMQNGDRQSITSSATFYDAGNGRNVGTATSPAATIPGAAQTFQTYDSPGFTSPVPNGFNGSAVVRTAEARTLVGVGVIRALNTASFEFYNSISASTATTRVTCASVLKNYYGYNTSVTIQNTGTAPTNLTLAYADASGRTLLAQTLTNLQPGASYFNYTPSNFDLPDGFSGSLVVQAAGQKIVGVVNELLGSGDRPGDQLFTYTCDNSLPGAASVYKAFAPVVLKNAQVR